MKIKTLAAITVGLLVSSSVLATPRLFPSTQVLEDGATQKIYNVKCNSKTSLVIAKGADKKWCYEGTEKSYCSKNQIKVARKACRAQ